MNHDPQAPSGPNRGDVGRRAAPFEEHVSYWRRVPVVFWVAAGVGLLGFFVQISSTTTVVDGTGYSCTYTNYAGFVVAAVVLVLAVIGWVKRSGRPEIEKLPLALTAGFTVVLFALAVVHVLRGTGTVMSGCEPPSA